MGSDAHIVLRGAPAGLAEWAVGDVERLELLSDVGARAWVVHVDGEVTELRT